MLTSQLIFLFSYVLVCFILVFFSQGNKHVCKCVSKEKKYIVHKLVSKNKKQESHIKRQFLFSDWCIVWWGYSSSWHGHCPSYWTVSSYKWTVLVFRLVYCLMGLFFVLAWPLSKLLDCILGTEHTTFYRRGQLKVIL